MDSVKGLMGQCPQNFLARTAPAAVVVVVVVVVGDDGVITTD